jgi:hypothetical protein
MVRFWNLTGSFCKVLLGDRMVMARSMSGVMGACVKCMG